MCIRDRVTSEDIHKIEFMIHNYSSLQYLRSLFREELFFPAVGGNTKAEALDSLTASMVETGLISEAFATAIKEREAIFLDISTTNIEPVSYTHLDVYKRQI